MINSDVVLPEWAIVWGSRILKLGSLNFMPGIEVFKNFLPFAAYNDYRVYFLGASEDTITKMVERVKSQYPEIEIAGFHHGYLNTAEIRENVLENIRQAKPDVIFVAMGSPKQEYWIARHRQAINASICLGVGGSFDIASGGLKRAPKVFQATGTEFLYRLMAEPRKRWANQKVLISYFIAVIGKKLVDFIMLNEEHEALVK